jgi:ribosomal protein S18 acetylase RimI-like enzyme
MIETVRTKLQLKTRPMTAKDIPAVTKISFACFSDSWLENKFVEMQDVLDFQVVVNRGGVIGYSAHQDCEDHIRIITLATVPRLRRAGAGKAMVDRLKFLGKPLEIIVSERNLGAQLFLKSQDFECRQSLRGEFGEGDDGLVFRF